MFCCLEHRGANNSNFKGNFRELLNTHNPCMVAFLETRMTSHLALQDEFGFDDSFEDSVIGRSGSIVLLWNTNYVTINRIRQKNQELHAMIKVHSSHEFWC